MQATKHKLHRARWGLALTAVAAMGASMLAAPVQGAVTGNRVMVVSPNDNIVLIEGLEDSTSYTVSVKRGATEIGSVTAVPADFGVAGALEINHAADPTLCWGEPASPDIQPGDTVSITDGTFTDSVLVQDITTGDAVASGANAFTVSGTLGAGLSLDNVNVFVRLVVNDQDWRADANTVDPNNTLEAGATAGTWTATFTEGDTPVDADVIAAAANPRVLEASYGVGDVPVEGGPNELTVVGPDAGDPHPGECPPVASHSLSTVSPTVINVANNGTNLTVSGVTSNSTAVAVNLSDGTQAVGPIAATITGTGTSQTWSATVPAASLAALNGTITVTATHTPNLGVAAQNTRTVLKDILAPAAPTVSPNGGAISGATSVFITGEGGAQLRYTVGNGTQASPTPTSGIVFNAPFTVVPGQTVKAIAVDTAGNTSALTTRGFTQAVPPPGTGSAAIIPLAPSIGRATSGKPGGPDTATARWQAPRANGAVIDRYRVRAVKIRPGRSAKIMPAVSAGANVKKLKMSLAAGKYKFQVRAVNAAGKSPWSARSNQVRAR